MASKANGFTFLSGVSCVATSNVLCLHSNRFKVEVKAGIDAKKGVTNTYSPESGSFSLFSSSNLEVMAKIVNGTAINGKFWVYHGGLTSLNYDMKITDTTTGVAKHYLKAANTYCGGADANAFSSELPQDGPVLKTFASCVPNATTACFVSNRFQVRVRQGQGTPPTFDPPYTYRSVAEFTPETALFYFASAPFLEVGAKIVDGTTINGKFWLYYGSLTDQKFQIEVKDTNTNVTKTWNSGGNYCGGADIQAF
jgi:hypothetical protein